MYQTLLDLNVLDIQLDTPNIITTEDVAMDEMIQIVVHVIGHLDQAPPKVFAGKEVNGIQLEGTPVN